MKKLTLLLLGVFSPVLIDLDRLRKSRLNSKYATRSALDSQSITVERNWHKQKNKKRQRKYSNKKYKRRQFYAKKHYSLKGTGAKDKRYSNQRHLRRMHTSYA